MSYEVARRLAETAPWRVSLSLDRQDGADGTVEGRVDGGGG